MRVRATWPLACLLVAVGLLTAACSGASGSATTVAPTTTTTAATTTTESGSSPLDATSAQAAVAPASTTIDGTLDTPDGRTRTYHLYVPSTLTGAAPLLIALHGGTGWGTQFERNSGFDGLAEANGFIVVYPDGIGVGADGTELRTWNGGDCCGPAVKQQVDDVGFIRLLIAQVRSQHDIDSARVFATGHSNGAILAYRLACELSDEIVAIGVQSAAPEVSTCTPAHAVSMLQIHGAADLNIPIDGGLGPNAISGVAFNRPVVAAQTLAAADGCPSAPVSTTDADNADLAVTSWSCPNGVQVAFVEVAGANHAWMGHAGGSGKVGPPYTKLDSSLAIWSFLSRHPRKA
ncbi:MAG: polyhydroxybutyrate depolymerase [Acidimicrobiaceae bacterium]